MAGFDIRELMNDIDEAPGKVWFWDLEKAVIDAERCVQCGVCVAACPHDALSLVVNGTQTTLEHAPDTCQGEQQCIALCPVEALSIQGNQTWADVLEGPPRVLATLEMSVCERCQVRFPADAAQRWCETCRIRRSDPFGSHLPEAAIKILRARGHDLGQ